MNCLKLVAKENHCIPGPKLLEMCQQFKTPFYLYDLNHVISQYRSLYSYIKWPRLRIYYAMKANYNIDILEVLKSYDGYLDTVSPAEVLLALKLGYKKEHILFTANNMTDMEMCLIKQHNVLFNIDSISRLEKYAQGYPDSEVCLRFNADVVAGENEKVQTGGDDTKFGILLEDVPKVKAIADKYNIKVVGLHEHTGSGISNTEKVYHAMKNLLSIADKVNFPHLQFINFGGGFKVPYHPSEAAIDYERFGTIVTQMFAEYCQTYGRELYMCFEPGKYVVAEAGYLVVQVNTVKNNKGRLLVGTDSGFSQLIRPALYGAYHHILNLSNPLGKLKKYDVCGNICESGDCFAKARLLPNVREGDYLVILNAGAYCFSMASLYNLRALPAEVVIQDNEVRLSRAMMTADQLASQIIQQYPCRVERFLDVKR